MKICHLVFLVYLFFHAYCDSDVLVGYHVTLAIPPAYSSGFVGRAFIMETDQTEPNFRTAVSVEALDDKYACSLDIFLGNAKVWSSGHFSRFYTADKCMLELTEDGDLQLKGQKEIIGWRSGTSGQGVQRLHLLETGNLILVDPLNLIKWQTFNFPTDVMLQGQRLSSRTRLTSFISNNSSLFYSFEIQYDKIVLYLNSGKWKYSYWEFKPYPYGEKNITYIELTSKALEIFNGKFQKVAQITSEQPQPVRFLALGNSTGNLGLYYYSAERQIFQASYQALNGTCDLPLACNPYGICTFSNACSCIRLMTKGIGSLPDCSTDGISEGLCGRNQAEMVELQGVTSILRQGTPSEVNISKDACANLCLDNCTCVAALYISSAEADANLQQCFLYGLVRGVKEIQRGSTGSYWVKMPKGSRDQVHGKSSGLKKWSVIVIGVVDGFIIFIVLAGIGYYIIQKRRQTSLNTRHTP
ncbi:G-type lectin S-receptor-like serine/threonine-protein kinase SD2-5 isoform X1 [Coffea eugenioides]|uniref:G-type lectin S-receptor-like serine/threonine-protein kinase SD2-5 isoform X1 n=1 Tax=Coffea eugenioides TaxID=49369 RepID=UPI000F605C29|nr:G-type lectin S-receptor-like serine/threonine-protein kinase SD2-5 isoform X1 [Coffea eugenioides]